MIEEIGNEDGSSASDHEILDYVMLALDHQPKRLDLWMMRFEIVRSLGLKESFVEAMRLAFADTELRPGIDWQTVRRLWDELAPGEEPPADVELPPGAAVAAQAEAQRARRFADIAQEHAPEALKQLGREYGTLRQQTGYFLRFARATREHLGRTTALDRADKLAAALGFDGQIFIKREDQHRCSTEREYAVAQCFIADALGRKRLICANEVDGFAFELARTAPRFGLKLDVVLSPEEQTNASLVDELNRRGARIICTAELDLHGEDTREGAAKLWARDAEDCHMALSFGTGPHPYPRMVNDFQMLLGQETALQLRAGRVREKRQIVIAAVNSEADAIGFMLPFLRNQEMELLLADADPGSDRKLRSMRWANYKGARREHAWLRATGHISYIPIRDGQAAKAQQLLEDTEGLHVSFEDARAISLTCGLIEGGVADRDLVVLVA